MKIRLLPSNLHWKAKLRLSKLSRNYRVSLNSRQWSALGRQCARFFVNITRSPPARWLVRRLKCGVLSGRARRTFWNSPVWHIKALTSDSRHKKFGNFPERFVRRTVHVCISSARREANNRRCRRRRVLASIWARHTRVLVSLCMARSRSSPTIRCVFLL